MSVKTDEPRVVAVTGGFGALGRAVGEAFVVAGDSVVLIDHTPEPDAALAGMGAALLLPGIDLTDSRAVRGAFDSAGQQLGKISVLINVVGGYAWELISSGSLDTWDRMYNMNVRTVVAANQAVLPHMRERGCGRIVCIGAQAAQRATAGHGAYAAAKSGVVRLVEALSDEVGKHSITVNAVLPSIIDTPQNRLDMPDGDYSKWVPPSAIAALVKFLASEDAGYITGAAIPISHRA